MAVQRCAPRAFTHLVSKHADGAGGGHFIRSEPHGRHLRRHSQNEHLRKGTGELSEHSDPEQAGLNADHFDPRSHAVDRGCEQSDHPQPLPLQQPCYWKYEGDVSQHIDHWQPVDGEWRHVVEFHEDVVDDSVLDPLERVAQRIRAKETHNEPSPPV